MRQAGDTALTIGPVACGQVVKYLYEPKLCQLLGQLFLGIRVRKEILDPFEAGFRCRPKSIQKINLGEEHREVGGELWHVDTLVMLH